MNRFPYENEIQQLVSLLINQYKISRNLLIRLVGEEKYSNIKSVLSELGEGDLTNEMLARMFVVDRGAELFSGSSEPIRELRIFLLKQLSEERLMHLYQRNPASGRKIQSPSYVPRVLAEKRWISGKQWPRDFVNALKFPLVYAGITAERNYEVSEIFDIEPRKKVPDLVEYQVGLKEKMLKVLNREQEKTRCIVTLPTGGGKTRVTVESFIDWLQPRFAEGKYLIWIAQGEELCEQAIACIADMWQEREFAESLRVYRYFGGKQVSMDDLIGGAVIASIQQIVSRIKNGDEALNEILRNCGAMIIDEAHHAVADSYNQLFTKAKQLAGEDLFPICGLTATPGRNLNQTSNLVDQFDAYLIRPELPNDEKYEKNPLLFFREKGYLATPEFILFDSDEEVIVNDVYIEESGDFDREFLQRLAEDETRNLKIIEYMLSLPSDSSVLVYSCTVKHAEFLCTVMNSMGYKAAFVSALTPKSIRRMYIKAFKNKEIQFLFNYGVLTTGFDAPKVDHLLICRPTSSIVLYEQMVGRGLRGKLFGGTETCKIVDFSTNIKIHGRPLAYARFIKEWELAKKVGV